MNGSRALSTRDLCKTRVAAEKLALGPNMGGHSGMASLNKFRCHTLHRPDVAKSRVGIASVSWNKESKGD